MSPRRKSAEPIRPRLQWVTGLTGLGLVCAAAGVLAVDAFQPDTPPDLVPRRVEVRQSGANYVLAFEVRNRGRETAASVRVEGRTATSRAEAVIDYVPGMGTAYGALVFNDDPRGAEIRISGWSAP
ncbi:hypothetical protein [Brevundimonas sp. GCM10030266]|uniref:hypothetical protein n=1 Tax=Brevundimonas sp. GCM10030266 TaxID=3273386 RepID=UPI003608CD22